MSTASASDTNAVLEALVLEAPTTASDAKVRARSTSPAKKAKVAAAGIGTAKTKATTTRKSSKDSTSSKGSANSKDRRESEDSTSSKEVSNATIDLSSVPILKPSTAPAERKSSPTRSTSPDKGSKTSKSTTTTKVVKKVSSKDKDKEEEKVKDKKEKKEKKSKMDPSETVSANGETLINDLKTRLKKADVVADKYKKQLVVLQSKLEDALSGQEKHEQTMTSNIERIELLMKDHQAAMKQTQDMQVKYEDDKAALLRDKAGAEAREEELTNVVRHLKETLAQRERRRSGEYDRGRSSRYDGHRERGQDRPWSPTYPRSNSVGPLSPSAARRDSSQNYARILRHKDRLIEQLQLELAEAHVKAMELENTTSERIQGLERMIIDTRVQNAKLLEDKEYFQALFEEQSLLQEQMLDRRNVPSHSASTISASSSISQQPSRDTPASSVFGISDHAAPDQVRKLEAEVFSLQDQNKALTQYVDTIVSKLMTHESLEPIFADGTAPGGAPPSSAASPTKGSAPPSLLSRAGSIFGGRGRPRPAETSRNGTSADVKATAQFSQPQQRPAVSPISDIPLTATTSRPSPNPNEDPTTATRVPIRRPMSMRISSSEWQVPASAVPQRGGPSPGSRQSSTQLSPKGPTAHRQSSYFSGISLPPPGSSSTDASSILSRAASDSGNPADATTPITDDAASIHTTTSEPRAPLPSHGLHRSNTVISSGAQPRPLRLVQAKIDDDNAAAERARRVANRQSWRGWFGKGNDPPVTSQGLASPPPPPYVASAQDARALAGQGQIQAQWPGQQQVYAQMASVQEERRQASPTGSAPDGAV